MLIGPATKKSNLRTIRRIKQALRDALDLPDEATVTLAELACLEEDCAPLETAFGLLRPNAPPLQYKAHKPADAIDADDLLQVSRAWGFNAQTADFAPFTKEI